VDIGEEKYMRMRTLLRKESLGLIPNLVIDCRLPEFVIPAKAGIQARYEYYMQFFRQFLTVIVITGVTTTKNRGSKI